MGAVMVRSIDGLSGSISRRPRDFRPSGRGASLAGVAAQITAIRAAGSSLCQPKKRSLAQREPKFCMAVVKWRKASPVEPDDVSSSALPAISGIVRALSAATLVRASSRVRTGTSRQRSQSMVPSAPNSGARRSG